LRSWQRCGQSDSRSHHGLGVEMDWERGVKMVLDELEGVAAQHMEEAEKHDMVIEALDLFWGAFRERLVAARLEEVEG
jgi:hypothetical protein